MPNVDRAKIAPANPVSVKGTAPRVIFLPGLFGAYAIDTSINNLDAAAVLTYRINDRTSSPLTISQSGVKTYNDTKIIMIEIVSGSNWEVELNLVPL